jgi:hypothetical protein
VELDALAQGQVASGVTQVVEADGFYRNAGLREESPVRAHITEVQGDHAHTIALLRESLALALRLRDTQNAAYGLEGLAGALAMMGQGPHAAQLSGAAEALRERTGSVIGFSTLRELHEVHLATLRAQLDAKTFEADWSEGRAMPYEQAVEYALEGDEASSPYSASGLVSGRESAPSQKV